MTEARTLTLTEDADPLAPYDLPFDEFLAWTIKTRFRAVPPVELHDGDRIAWMVREFDRTDRFSACHRIWRDGMTYCMVPVPPSQMHFALPGILKPCTRCEEQHGRQPQFSDLLAASQRDAA